MFSTQTRTILPTMQLLAGSSRLSLPHTSITCSATSQRQLVDLPRRQLAYRPKDKGVSTSPERSNKKPVGVHKSKNYHAAQNIKETLNTYKAKIEEDVEHAVE